MTVNSQSGPPKSPRPPDDLITTATSALRRFHFKTARNATKNSSKQSPSVPKVIVMGSSTASETTINTSTESSNTIVTTVTATDGTDDSLDYPEQMDLFSSDNVLDNSRISNQILQPCPLSPKTPATAKQQTPPTAKNQSMFTFEISETRSSTPQGDDTPKAYKNESNIFKEPDKKTVDSFMREQIEALRIDARRRNSYKQAAQNLDEIEVMSDTCFNSSSPKEQKRSFKKKLDVDKQKVEKSSPKRRAERTASSSPEETDSPRPKHRHKKSSRRTRSPNKYHHQTSENFIYDDRQVAKYRTRSSVSSTSSRRTPPPPDLRVDFFSETADSSGFQRPSTSCQMNGASTPTFHTLAVYGPSGGASTERRGSVCLNKCLREVLVEHLGMPTAGSGPFIKIDDLALASSSAFSLLAIPL